MNNAIKYNHLLQLPSFPKINSTLRAATNLLHFFIFLTILISPLFGETSHPEPLPFNCNLKTKIHKTFYNESTGRISLTKTTAYRSRIKNQCKEVKHNITRYYKGTQHLSKKKAGKKAKQKNEIQVYKILMKYLDQMVSLAEKAEKTDSKDLHIKFKRLALNVFELEYSQKVQGKKLAGTMLFEKIPESMKKWKIPVYEVKEGEASNLYDPTTGMYYSQQQLKDLKKVGGDISKLNPGPYSTFWTQQKIADINIADHYYGGSAMYHDINVFFPEKKAYFKKIRKTQTKPKMDVTIKHNGKNVTYKLKIGAEIHSEVTCASLYSALGFSVDISKFVKNFKVILGDISPLEFKKEWESYYGRYDLSKLVKDQGRDQDGFYIIFYEGVLEYKPKKLLRAGPWAYGQNGHRGLREVRSSLIFNMWVANLDLKEAENNKLILRKQNGDYRFFHIQHDMGFAFGSTYIERPGSFGWNVVKKSTKDHIHMSYRCFQKNSGFHHVTYADARWMVRLIARLSRKQIEAAVRLAGWPDSPGQLLVEKLISRRNQLVKFFRLEGEPSPDGGTFAPLPFDRHLTTEDGAVKNGKLKTYRFKGSPQYFGPRLNELVVLVLKALRNITVDTTVSLTGSIRYIELDPEWFGLDKAIVSKIIIRMGREIEPNPNPVNENDGFLVKDNVDIGLRMGYGTVVSGEVTYEKNFILVYPVQTRDKGRFNNKFILHGMLPFHTSGKFLPPNHVLITEDYLKCGGRLKFKGDDIPLSTHLTASRYYLQRSFISRKENRQLIFFQDKSNYNEMALKIYLELMHLFRFSLFKNYARQGKLIRDYVEISLDDLNTNVRKQEAVDRLVIDGDPGLLRKMGKIREIDDQFTEFKRSVRFFSFFKNRWVYRIDKIREKEFIRGKKERTGSKESESIPPVELIKHYYQVESRKLKAWQFFDNGERHFSRVRFSARTDGNDSLRLPLLTIALHVNDKSTSNKELKEGYLNLINTMALKNDFIDFNPTSHTVNGIWGHTQVFINIVLYEKALKNLQKANADMIWDSMAKLTNKSVTYWKNLAKQHYVRGGPRRCNYSRDRYLAEKTRFFIRTLKKSQAAKRSIKKMRLLVNAVCKTVYCTGKTFNPIHIALIHQLVGKDNIYMDAMVTMPENKENVFPARIPLFNCLGKDRGRHRAEFQFVFDYPADIYHLQ